MNAGWFARRFPLYKKTRLGTLKLCVDGKEYILGLLRWWEIQEDGLEKMYLVANHRSPDTCVCSAGDS
jgi:hypothetical protein